MSIRPIRSQSEETFNKQNQAAIDMYSIASSIYWGIKSILSMINRLAALKVITELFKILPGVSYAFTFFDFACDLVSSSVISSRSTHTRIAKSIIAVASLAAGILSFIVAGAWVYPLVVVVSLLGNLWDTGTIICSKLFGKLAKAVPNSKEHIESNGRLAEALHKTAISALYLIAAIMLSNPITAPIGCIGFIVLTSYMLSEVFKINPLRKLGNWLFNSPFDASEAKSDTSNNLKLAPSQEANGSFTATIKSDEDRDVVNNLEEIAASPQQVNLSTATIRNKVATDCVENHKNAIDDLLKVSPITTSHNDHFFLPSVIEARSTRAATATRRYHQAISHL